MQRHKCFEPTVGDVLYSLFLILHTRNVRLLALGFTIDLVSSRPGCLLIVILRRPPHFFPLLRQALHTPTLEYFQDPFMYLCIFPKVVV